MTRIRATRRHLRSVIENYENDPSLHQNDNNLNVAFIPDQNTEDILDSSGDESDADDENIPGGFYEIIFDKYDNEQKLLEPTHTYE